MRDIVKKIFKYDFSVVQYYSIYLKKKSIIINRAKVIVFVK